MTFAAGASASINKTLNEIEAILGGERLTKAGPKRCTLRKRLLAVLEAASVSWYRKGFNRGHREAHASFVGSGTVPRVLMKHVARKFLPSSPKRAVSLKSKVNR